MRPAQTPNRSGPLATLDAFLAAMANVTRPVEPRSRLLAEAIGGLIAEDVRAPRHIPGVACAARDGWAVASAELVGASPQSPLPLSGPPQFVSAGEPLPPGCDAVLPPVDVVVLGPLGEAMAEIAPGEGVNAPGSDAQAGQVIVAAGNQLRDLHLPILRAVGFATIAVRSPCVAIATTIPDPQRDTSGRLVSGAIAAAGGAPNTVPAAGLEQLEDALAATDADAVIVVGGTGEGPDDAAYRAIASRGEVVQHGVGLWPCPTSGLGIVGGRPILAVPGRPDSALAAGLMLATPFVRLLAGMTAPTRAALHSLTRKVVSRPGLVEFRLVAIGEDGATPLPALPLPLAALPAADGYLVIPAGSEGFAAGEAVSVYPLP